jgi:hypothetical protein
MKLKMRTPQLKVVVLLLAVPLVAKQDTNTIADPLAAFMEKPSCSKKKLIIYIEY